MAETELHPSSAPTGHSPVFRVAWIGTAGLSLVGTAVGLVAILLLASSGNMTTPGADVNWSFFSRYSPVGLGCPTSHSVAGSLSSASGLACRTSGWR